MSPSSTVPNSRTGRTHVFGASRRTPAMQTPVFMPVTASSTSVAFTGAPPVAAVAWGGRLPSPPPDAAPRSRGAAAGTPPPPAGGGTCSALAPHRVDRGVRTARRWCPAWIRAGARRAAPRRRGRRPPRPHRGGTDPAAPPTAPAVGAQAARDQLLAVAVRRIALAAHERRALRATLRHQPCQPGAVQRCRRDGVVVRQSAGAAQGASLGFAAQLAAEEHIGDTGRGEALREGVAVELRGVAAERRRAHVGQRRNAVPAQDRDESPDLVIAVPDAPQLIGAGWCGHALSPMLPVPLPAFHTCSVRPVYRVRRAKATSAWLLCVLLGWSLQLARASLLAA